MIYKEMIVVVCEINIFLFGCVFWYLDLALLFFHAIVRSSYETLGLFIVRTHEIYRQMSFIAIVSVLFLFLVSWQHLLLARSTVGSFLCSFRQATAIPTKLMPKNVQRVKARSKNESYCFLFIQFFT